MIPLYKAVKNGGVALLAEGVGRNGTSAKQRGGSLVALLAEGVGRNSGQ